MPAELETAAAGYLDYKATMMRTIINMTSTEHAKKKYAVLHVCILEKRRYGSKAGIAKRVTSFPGPNPP